MAAAALFEVASLVSVEELQDGSMNVLLDNSSCCASLLLPESYYPWLADLLTLEDRMRTGSPYNSQPRVDETRYRRISRSPADEWC